MITVTVLCVCVWVSRFILSVCECLCVFFPCYLVCVYTMYNCWFLVTFKRYLMCFLVGWLVVMKMCLYLVINCFVNSLNFDHLSRYCYLFFFLLEDVRVKRRDFFLILKELFCSFSFGAISYWNLYLSSVFFVHFIWFLH